MAFDLEMSWEEAPLLTTEDTENTEVAQRKNKSVSFKMLHAVSRITSRVLPFLCATSVFSVSSVVKHTRCAPRCS
jgi:hypothetical protein